MLDLQPASIALSEARETEIRTSYGTFFAKIWRMHRYGWLAHVTFELGDDVTIQRKIPTFMSEIDAAAWIQQALADGPRFIVPLLEDV